VGQERLLLVLSSEEIYQVLGIPVAAGEIVHEHHLNVGGREHRLIDLQSLAREKERGAGGG